MNNWKNQKLGDVINFRRGHDLPRKNMIEGDIPVIGSNGIIGYHNEYTTKSPCVTIGRSGNVGLPLIVKQNCWAHNTTLYIDNFKGNDPEFIYYFLQILNLGNYRGGSAVPTLNRNHIYPIEVKIPPLPIQRRIAAILSALDDKIENNRRICETLEQIAQAIFKRWFVDFDFPCLPQDYRPSGQVNLSDEFKSIMTYRRVGGLPIPEKSKWFVYVLLCEDGSFYKGITKDLYRRFYEHYTGKGSDWTKTHKPVKVIHYESFASQEEAAKREQDLKTGFGRTWLHREYEKLQKERGGLPAPKTKLRQAGKMVESELGLIPEGWKVTSLIDAINIFDSKRIPLSRMERNQRKGNIPYYGATGVMDFVDEPLFEGDHLLMAEDGSVMDEQGFPIVQHVWGKFWVNNHAHIFTGKLVPNSFLYFWLKQFNVKEYVTGAVQLKISQSSMKRMIFNYPNNEMKNVFDKLFIQIKHLKEENNILQQTRDTLLPKLMSGEVEV